MHLGSSLASSGSYGMDEKHLKISLCLIYGLYFLKVRDTVEISQFSVKL